MLVMVKYLNGSYDIIVSHRLDGLIKADKILAFRRGNGWVRVGKDPVRGEAIDFTGEDRRKKEAVGQLMM